MKSKTGRVVTKKQHAKGKALFAKFARHWLDAVMQARKSVVLGAQEIMKALLKDPS